MSALLALTLLQAAGQSVASPPCVGGLCDAQRLAPVFAKLAASKATRSSVRIIQIGDSHTAGDQITGSWRTLLQTRFGSAGRGVLPPGRPYAGYLTRGITASQSAGWVVNGIFGSAYRGPGAPPLGLSGYTLTSATPGASIGLTADTIASWFDHVTVCALTRPGGGTLRLSAGSSAVDWSLDAPSTVPACRTITAAQPTDTAAVTLASGDATITSWSTERPGMGGIILSNLGTVGAQLEHVARTDDRVVAAELASYRPDLIVVAFGTNEAFRPGFVAATYETILTDALARLRRLAPGVPLLILGAPDSATRLPGLQAQGGMSSAACVTPSPPPAAPAASPVLVQPLPADPGSGWRPTVALAVVQATQRRVAHASGAAFWDWSGRMGGRCTAHGWTVATPPLMRGDHVHFTTSGGARIAGLLEADLGAAMAGPVGMPGPTDERAEGAAANDAVR